MREFYGGQARRLDRAIVAAVALVLAACGLAGSAAALDRSTADRPDEVAAPMVHAVYALPSDGADRALDTNGVLAASVDSWEAWFAGQTGGERLRLDTFGGALDVTFVRLGETDAELARQGAFLRDAIERELGAAGFLRADKVYAVYYDGSSPFACGGGAWPPTLPGRVAALYLHGAPPGAPPCDTNRFAGPGEPPGYLEFAMIHELLHTLGFVPTCAPHHTRAGHVSDDPSDLMWAGDAPWTPAVLDAGHDDYFHAGLPGCLDLADSPYLGEPATPPPPPPPPVAVRRTVSLSLSGRLVASGRLRAELARPDCTARVRVQLQRRQGTAWRGAASGRTDAGGRYRLKVGPRRGLYRTVAPAIGTPAPTCLRAVSPGRAFR
jgi:hypothetical protein